MVKACTVDNAPQNVVRHDVPCPKASEVRPATKFNGTGLAESMEVCLQGEVDAVCLVISDATALRLLFSLGKVHLREVEELVRCAQLATDASGCDFASLATPL